MGSQDTTLVNKHAQDKKNDAYKRQIKALKSALAKERAERKAAVSALKTLIRSKISR